MKLEFLDITDNGANPNASPKEIIRLFEFSDPEKESLIEQVQEVIIKQQKNLELHKLPFIKAINCSVTLSLSREDAGLLKEGSSNNYACYLTLEEYKKFIDIIRHVGEAYNWLTPGEYLDEPAFLISKWGTW